jgi:CRISPR-associated protein Cmr1
MKRKLPVDHDGNAIVAPESIKPQLETKKLIQDGGAKEINLIRETREYELITPLFGGGTETQKADPVSVIRVPSIRGQLRFWWRATRGGQFKTTAEMKKAEDLIWGSTENPSAVIIELQVNDGSIPETAYWMELNTRKGKFEIKNSTMIAPYAAFPLQPDKNEQKKTRLEIRSRCPQRQLHIEPSFS